MSSDGKVSAGNFEAWTDLDVASSLEALRGAMKRVQVKFLGGLFTIEGFVAGCDMIRRRR